MNKLRSFLFLIGLCLIVMAAQVVWGQEVSTKIYATDGSTWQDSIKIGTHSTSGTDCIDAGLTEFEAPPTPPTGVADLRAVEKTCLGQGLQQIDLHGLTISTETDTFKLGFKSSTEGGAVTLSWSATIGSIGAGYWKLKDASGLSLFPDVDMTTTTSFTHPFASTSPQYVYIIKGDGQKMWSCTYDQLADAKDNKGKQAPTKATSKAGKPINMPNINNVIQDTYTKGGSMSMGKSGNPKSVSHPKYKDVMASANNKGIKHAGAAKCLDNNLKGKAIAKTLKALKPGKDQDNKFFAAMLATELAIQASGRVTPAGFGSLVYNKPGNPYHGMTVNSIMAKGDDYLSCDLTGLLGGATANDFFDVFTEINAAFDASALDTADWFQEGNKLGNLVVKGNLALAEAPNGVLYRTSMATPEVTPVLPSVEAVPEKYGLSQNYPNPFNPTTTIEFNLAEDAIVTLKIYNAIGQEVATLLDREELYSGDQEFDFDAAGLPSGVYFYRLVANGLGDAEEGIAGQTYVSTMKMLLMK